MDWIYSGLFHVPLFVAVYVNLLLLVPRLLNRRKFIFYGFSVFFLILFNACFLHFIFDFLIDYIFPGYYFISNNDIKDYFSYVSVYVLVTTLMKLSKSWFDVMEARRKLVEMKQEKIQTELYALKSQINPHFLFNGLNSIYSLAIDQEPLTPKFILKFSDVLRYMLYEADADTVLLAKEINYLENYVELQKLRVEEGADIRFEIEGIVDTQQIAPFLLIPLVENGFKHGIKGETQHAFIHMLIKVESNDFEFHIKNNQGKSDDLKLEKFKGIGLQNVKRRLELLYPQKHQLEIEDNEKVFSVKLKLDLS